MKLLNCCHLLVLLLVFARPALAQGNDDAPSLIKQAVQFNKDGKYAKAADKFTQALKLEPANVYANYGIAYSLMQMGKANDGIPYLEKVIKANSSLTAGAYDLLGSIYDKGHESEKAIAAFNEGIKIDPAYQRLHYNLGLVYFRDKKYAEAEKCATDAIKLDPKHANSHRMYALVCFHQNKRAAALLGFCSFILLEPQTARSSEAYGNIQHILQGGTLKPAPGETAPLASDANTLALNQAISQAAAEAAKGKYATPADQLTAQLSVIFKAVGALAEKQAGNDFFREYFAAWFYKLALSPNMPAFARLISSAANKDDYSKWLAEHSREADDLNNWIAATPRSF